jgi:hypothetical protein
VIHHVGRTRPVYGDKILALCRNVIVARAAYAAAVEQRAGKRVKLMRGPQVHADSAANR